MSTFMAKKGEVERKWNEFLKISHANQDRFFSLYSGVFVTPVTVCR